MKETHLDVLLIAFKTICIMNLDALADTKRFTLRQNFSLLNGKLLLLYISLG